MIIYGINPGQHSVAAFYRNSAIHWFVNRAITELAWFMVLESDAADPLPQAWAHGFALRDLASQNGTFVRGQRVDGSCQLANGDDVRLGDAPFVFHG